MKSRALNRSVLVTVLLLSLILSPPVYSAGTANQIGGDWRLKITGRDRQRESILSFSRDKAGTLSGKWLSMYGASELRELEIDGSKIAFTRVSTFRDQETVTTFPGTLEKNRLNGILKSPQGESTVEGTRISFISRAAGSWQVHLKGSKPQNAKLSVTAGRKGKLDAAWQNGTKEAAITDMQFKNNTLTFKMNGGIDGKAGLSDFEGTIKGHKLTGILKTHDGVIPVEATRFGADLIGKWNLEVTSDSGARKQLLSVRPDMSAIYGSTFIDRINLDGNSVSFKASRQLDERSFETTFTAVLDNKKLTGEITTSRGTTKVVGTRMYAPAQAAKQKEKFRKPDVIFVPTPQKVVDQMLELAQLKKDDIVYDLGCGDGRIVVTAAKEFGCTGFGYDISAKRVTESLENVQKANVNDLVTIERKDIFTLDLSKADVITLYLLPSLNVKLIPQLEKCKPGTRIVSHDFDMEGVKPDKVITIEDDKDQYGDHTIYLWTAPLKKDKIED